MSSTPRTVAGLVAALAVLAGTAGIAGCGGTQGTADPAGRTAGSVSIIASSAGAQPTGASPDADGDAPLPTACSLLTRAEAEKLAGTPLGDPLDAQEYCQFAGDPTGPTAQVEVFVGPGAEKALNVDRGLGHEFATVDRLGDEAHAEDFSVFFRKGTTWVQLRLVRLEDPQGFAAALVELARTMATRL